MAVVLGGGIVGGVLLRPWFLSLEPRRTFVRNYEASATHTQQPRSPAAFTQAPLEDGEGKMRLKDVDFENTSHPAYAGLKYFHDGFYNSRFTNLEDAELRRIGITREQAMQAQEVYNRLATDRLNIERTIAKVEPISPQKSIIIIPPYADRGLEEKFYSTLSNMFGEKISQNINNILGTQIRLANGGFGYSTQQLIVTVDGARWEVVHSTTSSDGATAVVTNSVTPKRMDGYQALASLFPQLALNR